eukprot:TRINITY_DN2780_c0_g7_i1.p1 TRINITY_DN2780_c0_g7~~TRINITY_DN2780_c0_g7_i1.p1  ORF type:complete len:250 (+),score=76.22 TRINITY_DN2780_c0_g7_i1:69-818(+)
MFCCEAKGDGDAQELTLAPANAGLSEAPRLAELPLPETKEEEEAAPTEAAATEAPAAPAAPAAPLANGAFLVDLDSASAGGHGLKINTQYPDLCIITEIIDKGPASKWNSQCNPDQVLKKMDCIIKVGETTGNAEAMSNALNSVAKVQITAKRPKINEIQLDKLSAGLGATIHFQDSCPGILINGIKDSGALATFNSSNPDKEVKTGDRIIDIFNVTDYTSSHESITRLIKEAAAEDKSVQIRIATWDY